MDNPASLKLKAILPTERSCPCREGPIVVGIDGAYLRNWHDKQKKFEVIVGKSVPAGRGPPLLRPGPDP